MSRNLVYGGIYRHFKNKLYMVKDVVTHSETGEKMVLYQALYGDFRSYVRPLHMFLSEVDHDRYPDAPQKYRFTRVLLDESGKVVGLPEEEAGSTESAEAGEAKEANESNGANGAEEDSLKAEESLAGPRAQQQFREDCEEIPDPLLLDFLDIPSLKEKCQFLNLKRRAFSAKTLAQCAAAMDISLPEGDVNAQFLALRDSLLMRAKYEENDRLRLKS